MALLGRLLRSRRCSRALRSPLLYGGFSEAPSSRRGSHSEAGNGREAPLFEADWSFLTSRGLSEVVREMLADLMGLPPSPPDDTNLHLQNGRRRSAMANIEEIYAQQRLRRAGEQGYLVRGLIWDVSALMQSGKSQASQPRVHEEAEQESESLNREAAALKRAELAMRDWEAFVVGEQDESTVVTSNAEKVKIGMTLSEIMPEIEQDPVTGEARRTTLGRSSTEDGKLRSSVGEDQHVVAKAQKSKQQELEEAMGRQESVRAKYMAKIMEKKLLADVRREQGKFSIGAAKGQGDYARPPSDLGNLAREKGWVSMPGASNLLRHFRERGLLQALLEPLQQDDLTYLEDQLGNFPFNFTAHISRDQPVSRKRLESICSSWGLQSKQVMLVVGAGQPSKDILRAARSCGFFVTRISDALPLSGDGEVKKSSGDESSTPLMLSMAKPSDEESSHHIPGVNRSVQVSGENTSIASKEAVAPLGNEVEKASRGSGEEKPRGGFVSWYKKLAEGTLHVEEQMLEAQRDADVHFRVADMTELKWVIEDLNGVSYRRSTFVRGQESSGQSPAIVMRQIASQA